MRSVRLSFVVAALATALALASGCGGSGGDSASPASRLARDTGVDWDVDTDPSLGTPDLVAARSKPAPIVVGGISEEEAAYRFFEKYRGLFGMTDPRSELAPTLHDVDGDSATHVGFDQVSAGIRVVGGGYNVHFTPDGSLAFLNGKYLAGLDSVSHAPAIDAARATAIAQAMRKTIDPSWSAASLAAPPPTELVFLAAPGAPHVLAWRVDVASWTFDVDAQTGVVLRASAHTMTSAATGTGVHGDTKSFEVIPSGAGYAMQTPPGGIVVSVRDYLGTKVSTDVLSTDLASWDTTWPTKDPNGNGTGLAVDGFTGVQKVFVWYKSELGWSSYDGNGGPLRIIVHDDSQGADNAFWVWKDDLEDPKIREIHLGDGNARTPKGDDYAESDFDTLTHELTHGVTEYTSTLEYCQALPNGPLSAGPMDCALESSGLNESFSDIFASLAQPKLESGGDPQIYGELSKVKPGENVRDMMHPRLDQEGDRMAPGKDCYPSGGVHGTDAHQNAGISNNAYALMRWGGTNDSSKITVAAGLPDAAAERLWWLTQRYLLWHKPHTTFADVARVQLATIRSYSWFPSFLSRWFPAAGVAIKPVACAWVATGVIPQKLVKDQYDVTCYCEKPNPPANVCSGDAVLPDDQLPCCKSCVDAGSPGPGSSDAGGGDSGGGRKTIFRAFDSCDGRADGTYCSDLASYSAFVCKNNSIAYGVQCTNMRACIGPNGPGTLQCEGDPPGGGGGGGPDAGPMGDTCAGRADGLYCSVDPSLSFYAYQCTGGTTSGSQYCPSGKKCIGPNGAGTTIMCQ